MFCFKKMYRVIGWIHLYLIWLHYSLSRTRGPFLWRFSRYVIFVVPGLYQAATDNSKILFYIVGFVLLAKFTLCFSCRAAGTIMLFTWEMSVIFLYWLWRTHWDFFFAVWFYFSEFFSKHFALCDYSGVRFLMLKALNLESFPCAVLLKSMPIP